MGNPGAQVSEPKRLRLSSSAPKFAVFGRKLQQGPQARTGSNAARSSTGAGHGNTPVTAWSEGQLRLATGTDHTGSRKLPDGEQLEVCSMWTGDSLQIDLSDSDSESTGTADVA